MSKLLAIVARLKAILIAASVAFARGDMLAIALGPGMSAVPSVRIDPSLSVAERLGRFL
jgi:hypothetical protein